MMSELELEFIRYQRLAGLGRDLGGFVHNAAGPLNIIMGYLQVLQAKYPNEMSVNKIWQAGLEIDELLKELGSHVENIEKILVQDIDVKKLIMRQLELLRANNYFKHNVELVEEYSEQEIWWHGIYGDIVLMLDVVFNNAIEAVYNSDIKKIYLETALISSLHGDSFRLLVRDTGNGIEERLKNEYFQPGTSYWKKTLNKCSGMGLALAKYLCDHYQGAIILQNSDGIGAETIIELPLR